MTKCFEFIHIYILHNFVLLAIEVAQDLRKYILEIYDEHLTSDGQVRTTLPVRATATSYVHVLRPTGPPILIRMDELLFRVSELCASSNSLFSNCAF